MPYIESEERDAIINSDFSRMSPGHLNYAITRLCLIYIARKGLNYTHLNDVIGALECAKLEMYRRKIVPYEDFKIKENGDIPGYENPAS